MRCDVAVVGAGPAGAATAMLLARAGHIVALLDRASFPRAKPCGDCLSPGAGPVLRRLGLLERVEAASPARLVAWRLVSPGGREVRSGFAGALPDAEAGLAISRERLDALLVEAAVEAGARLLPRHHVVGLERGADGTGWLLRARGGDGEAVSLTARALVAADGLRSALSRRLGLAGRPGRLRKVSLTAHARGVAGSEDTGELHVGRGTCAGLAPVGRPEPGRSPDDVVHNITVVADARAAAPAVRRDPEAFFHATLRSLPGLRGRLDRVELLPHAGGGRLLASGPFHRPTRGLVTRGAALVGDAAGYYDPFTGQGIHHALAGAERLAPVLDDALRAGDLSPRRLSAYARPHRRALAEARLLQRLVEAVISRPGLCDAALARLDGRPSFARRLLAVTGDLRPARSLLAPASLLGFLLSLDPPTP